MSSKQLVSVSRPPCVMSRSMRRKLPPYCGRWCRLLRCPGRRPPRARELLPVLREYGGDVLGVERLYWWAKPIRRAAGVTGPLLVESRACRSDHAEVEAA